MFCMKYCERGPFHDDFAFFVTMVSSWKVFQLFFQYPLLWQKDIFVMTGLSFNDDMLSQILWWRRAVFRHKSALAVGYLGWGLDDEVVVTKSFGDKNGTSRNEFLSSQKTILSLQKTIFFIVCSCSERKILFSQSS